jgi:tetratricopeptide (TPR) repeat protein
VAIKLFRTVEGAVAPPGSEDWAVAKHALGIAYRSRIWHERTSNLELAIECLSEASEAGSPTATLDLATAYFLRRDSGDLERAERRCREAIKLLATEFAAEAARDLLGLVVREAGRPLEAIDLHLQALGTLDKCPSSTRRALAVRNLGIAYADANRLEDAIPWLEKARDSHERGSRNWAEVQLCLGQAYSTAKPDEARECYLAALEFYQSPLEWDAVTARLGLCRLADALEIWKEVVDNLQQAIELNDRRYELALTWPARSKVLREVVNAPSLLAYAQAKLDRAGDAVTALEAQRVRWLSESLRLRPFDESLPPEDREEYRKAVAEYHSLQAESRLAPSGGERSYLVVDRELRRVQEALARLRIEQAPQVDLPSLSAKVPLVYIVSTRHGGVALVVRGGATRALWLPKLVDHEVRRRLDGWLPNRGESLIDAVNNLTAWLWPAAVGPLLDELGDICDVVLVPCGVLAFLPFHAAWRKDHGGLGREYALDRVAIRYTPTASAIRTPNTDAASVLAVEGPRLPFSPGEVQAAKQAFALSMLIDSAHASRSAVLEAMPKSDVLHFCSHAKAELNDPLESHLELAGGERLTLRDVLGLTPRPIRLAVLSGCTTAVPGTPLPDEVVSLATGLLHAGAQGVVASLWPVDDECTNQLMREFYSHWRKDGRESMPPHLALRLAQLKVRGTHPDPFYWAGFAYSGS